MNEEWVMDRLADLGRWYNDEDVRHGLIILGTIVGITFFGFIRRLFGGSRSNDRIKHSFEGPAGTVATLSIGQQEARDKANGKG